MLLGLIKPKSKGKKYELIPPDKRNKFSTNKDDRLFQIKNINTGELGGYIEKESNLAQDGDCWIDESSKVYGNARVEGNAQIEHSIIKENALISDNAYVKNSTISGDAKIYDSARVIDCTIDDMAEISDRAQINKLLVHNKSKIYKNSAVNMDGTEYLAVNFDIKCTFTHNDLAEYLDRMEEEDEEREIQRRAYNEV